MISITGLTRARPGGHELAGVDRREQRDRDGEEQRVQAGLQRPEDQRPQAELGLEVVGAAAGLPGVARPAGTLVPDRPEQRGQRGLGVRHVRAPAVQRTARFGVQAVVARGERERGHGRVPGAQPGQDPRAGHVHQLDAPVGQPHGEQAVAQRGRERGDRRAPRAKRVRRREPLHRGPRVGPRQEPSAHAARAVAYHQRAGPDQLPDRRHVDAGLGRQVQRLRHERRVRVAHVDAQRVPAVPDRVDRVTPVRLLQEGRQRGARGQGERELDRCELGRDLVGQQVVATAGLQAAQRAVRAQDREQRATGVQRVADARDGGAARAQRVLLLATQVRAPELVLAEAFVQGLAVHGGLAGLERAQRRGHVLRLERSDREPQPEDVHGAVAQAQRDGAAAVGHIPGRRRRSRQERPRGEHLPVEYPEHLEQAVGAQAPRQRAVLVDSQVHDRPAGVAVRSRGGRQWPHVRIQEERHDHADEEPEDGRDGDDRADAAERDQQARDALGHADGTGRRPPSAPTTDRSGVRIGHCFTASWLHGFMAARIHGCTDSWLHGFMASARPAPAARRASPVPAAEGRGVRGEVRRAVCVSCPPSRGRTAPPPSGPWRRPGRGPAGSRP
jgi:hypothetical protein